jgi:O-antigen ligase
MPDSHNLSSMNLRNGIHFCTFEIIKNDLLFGIGIGDVQNELNKCYKINFDTTLFQRRVFNTHNYYLFLVSSAGVFALISFIIFYISILLKLLKKREYFLMSAYILLFIVFFSESFLQRAYGVSTFCILQLSSLNKLKKQN